MNTFSKIIVSLFLAMVSFATANAQQIRIITDTDQRVAWERFDQYMQTEYSGSESFFQTVVNGKTFRFKIDIQVGNDFLSAMNEAEAVCFFGTKYIMAWFPDQPEPSWTDLVPGFYQKYKSCFLPVDFTPPQKKVPNLLRKHGNVATKKLNFYKFERE